MLNTRPLHIYDNDGMNLFINSLICEYRNNFLTCNGQISRSISDLYSLSNILWINSNQDKMFLFLVDLPLWIRISLTTKNQSLF